MKKMVIALALSGLGWSAQAGHLTLPFSDAGTPLWQGWYYNNGGRHQGIDYGCGCGTPILAAHSGYATSWYQPYNPNDPKDYSYG